MCEICIVVVDRAHNAAYKAGDVVQVLPDGADWGTEPIKNPEWRIVKIPGMAVDTFFDMCQTLTNQGAVVRKRARGFDISKPAIQAVINSSVGVPIVINITAQKNALLAARFTKPAFVPVIG